MSTIPFIQASQYLKAHRERISHIVIHTMEVPCIRGMAKEIATRCSKIGPLDRARSAHYFVDPEEIWQGVHDKDVAYQCKKLNRTGIGVEHAGRAQAVKNYPATDWGSDAAQSMLALSAVLVAGLCDKYDIPVTRLSDEDLLHGKPGIVGHDQATRVFRVEGGHVDPGPTWPWEKYLEMVAREKAALLRAAGQRLP